MQRTRTVCTADGRQVDWGMCPGSCRLAIPGYNHNLPQDLEAAASAIAAVASKAGARRTAHGRRRCSSSASIRGKAVTEACSSERIDSPPTHAHTHTAAIVELYFSCVLAHHKFRLDLLAPPHLCDVAIPGGVVGRRVRCCRWCPTARSATPARPWRPRPRSRWQCRGSRRRYGS